MARPGAFAAASSNIFGTKTPRKRRKSALEEDIAMHDAAGPDSAAKSDHNKIKEPKKRDMRDPISSSL